MSKLVSPNELLASARELMLDGREPKTRTDWMLVFNHFAVNVHRDVQPAALLFLRICFDTCLTEDDVKQICAFHKGERA